MLKQYKIYIILSAILLAFIGGGVAYLEGKHRYDSAIAAAKREAVQEVLLEQERAINKAVQIERDLNQLEKQELKKEIQKRDQEVSALRRKLEVDHELDALMQAKPGLVLKAVQNGTDEVLKEFEEITKWEE